MPSSNAMLKAPKSKLVVMFASFSAKAHPSVTLSLTATPVSGAQVGW